VPETVVKIGGRYIYKNIGIWESEPERYILQKNALYFNWKITLK
jgi:hypothetical protein